MALTLGEPQLRIGSIEASLAQRVLQAGLPLRSARAQCQVLAPEDASLAAIAKWLNANGIAGPWREELLAVTDEQLRPVACVERAAARALGITTFAVHLVASRSDAGVWVQQRAQNKATDPGLWDTTMGGQVGAGESVLQALERETREEAGLSLAQLHGLTECERIIIRRPVVQAQTQGYMVEHIAVFEATLAEAVIPVNQDGEVQRFECLSPQELLVRLQGEHFTLEAALIMAQALQRRGVL
ncbi:MAG: NUDIX domain-containing protein [Burkholderiaceae bacterium]